MQNRFGLLVSDVTPIYMIMPRYSHDYSLFYQLLDSNLFTHRNTYAILREATSETYGPGSILHHISFHLFYFAIFTFNLYHKNRKILISLLSSLSYLTLASGCEGINNPFIALVARFLFICVGTRWLAPRLLLDWYLGSQKPREILMLLCCITLSSSRENQRSAQEVATCGAPWSLVSFPHM